jgi:hypothetical protein
MADQVARELIAMVVRIGAIAGILAVFYMTVGLGDQVQTLSIGAAAAFGSQTAAFGARRLMGDRRAKPWVIALFGSLALIATAIVLLRA